MKLSDFFLNQKLDKIIQNTVFYLYKNPIWKKKDFVTENLFCEGALLIPAHFAAVAQI